MVVRYHESFVSIHSRLQYLEKQTHFMKLESLSMRFKNKKAAQFPLCQRIISTPSRSVYNPYNGQLLNGSNSKYDRQSYSPTCTSQQNLLKCNEQSQLIQHEQYSRTFDHIVEAQSVPALKNNPPPHTHTHNHLHNQLRNQLHNLLCNLSHNQLYKQFNQQPAPQPVLQPALQPAPQPAPQEAPQPASQPTPQST